MRHGAVYKTMRVAGRQFWLFTLYDKDEMEDLGAKEKVAPREMPIRELEARR